MIKRDEYNFAFDPSACDKCGGKCCTGESGYIKTTIAEAIAIAEFIGVEFEEFASRYLIKIGYGFSLTEKAYEDGFACVFFDEANKNCGIYQVRPAQCSEFPFWPVFKYREEEVRKECPGIC